MKQIGFKAFDNNLQCRGFQYKVGKTYKEKSISICSNGFHWCKRLEDVFSYYPRNEETRVCEILADGEFQTEGNKSVSQSIEIIRELSKEEIKNILNNNAGSYNAGSYNAGSYNAGNRNAGHDNAGHDNAGTGNAGNRNAGHDNAGTGNAGTGNAGNRNAGNRNAGNRNAGHDNAGHDNAGTGNAGIFNISIQTVKMFDKDSGLSWDSDIIKELKNKLECKVKPILRYIFTSEMTEQEKSEFPSHKITGGFLRNMGRNDYSALNNQEDRKFFESLPNFDAEIFFQITNVDWRERPHVQVIINGVTKMITYEKAKEIGLVD